MNEKTSVRAGTGASTRIETTKYVINLLPRISATKLAEYIVADPARKETILKNAKRALKSIILQYGRARNGLSDSLIASGISKRSLQQHAAEAQGDASKLKGDDERWERADARRSAEALIHLGAIADQVVLENAKQIHRPQGGWGRLSIEGVTVSVQPELVFSIEHRGIGKVGAIILNTAKTDAFTLERVSGRFSMGDYLTVLVYRLLEERLKGSGTPLHSNCFAIDVFRSKVYSAPKAHKTLLKNIEAACRTIAALWPTISIETDAIETEQSGSVVGTE